MSRRDAGRPTPGRRRRLARAGALLLVLAAALAACSGTASPGGAQASASATRGPGVATGARASPGAPTSPAAQPSPGPTSTAAIPAGAPNRPTGSTQDAVLDRVVDGDTIRVRIGGTLERVRYIGINAPELNSSTEATPQPFAEAAAQANTRLLMSGARLVLERQISERDEFGRLLRDVWVEGGGRWIFVNLVLVAEGYAQAGTWPPDVKHADLLRAAQRLAQRDLRGLWGVAP